MPVHEPVATPGVAWIRGGGCAAGDCACCDGKTDMNKNSGCSASGMRVVAQDLTNKIEENQSRYVDKDRYCSGGKYSSCSAKTISQVREW